MLEKSLPYSDIIMKADHVTASTWKPAYLPDGYSFKMYEEMNFLWISMNGRKDVRDEVKIKIMMYEESIEDDGNKEM